MADDLDPAAVERAARALSGWSDDLLDDKDGPNQTAYDMARAALTAARAGEPAAHPCGDYPAPCNCDDPGTHDAAAGADPVTAQQDAAEVLVCDALYAAEPDARPDSAVAFMEASARARTAVDALAAAGLLVTPEHDSQVAAKALRDAAGALDAMQTPDAGLPHEVRRDPALWLHARADRIEREEGEGR